MLAALGSVQITTLKDEAVARSSSAILLIRNVSPSGLDMFIRTVRTTQSGPATIALGLKGMDSRKMVESAWVITIPLTKPTRFAILGARRAVSPVIMFDAATRGPLNTSVTLNRK